MNKPRTILVAHERLGLDDADNFRLFCDRLATAPPGSVLSCPWPVTIYHEIDGMWIASADLPAFHSPGGAGGTPPPDDADEESDED